jgi:hypothetical protein
MGGLLGRWGGTGNLLENGGAGGVSRRPAPGRRLGGCSIWWQVGWLEAVHRNSVGPVADLELKGERSAAKDLERARVGRAEGGVGGGGANENKRGGEELRWQEWRRGSGWWLRKGARKGSL